MGTGGRSDPPCPKPRKWIHWILKDHICRYCGANLLHPSTTEECPSRPKKDKK